MPLSIVYSISNICASVETAKYAVMFGILMRRIVHNGANKLKSVHFCADLFAFIQVYFCILQNSLSFTLK